METIRLEPVDAITVTTLVDNVTDSLLADEGPATRPSMTALPRVAARFFAGGDTDDALRAEHGFAALVTIVNGERQTRVLFDAGRTPDGLVENMRRLDLRPADIDIIVLSHGHWDHVTGMEGLVGSLGRASVPVLIHPAFWTRRRLAFPGRDAVELPTTSKRALEGAGFQIVEQRHPSFLLDGSLLVTGEVDRTTAFERGFPGHEAHVHGAWQPDPLILDDQALVAIVRGRGLVVLTGCGHSGIVNIVRYVQKLTESSESMPSSGASTSAGRRSSRSSAPRVTRSPRSARTFSFRRTARGGARRTRLRRGSPRRSSRTASGRASRSSPTADATRRAARRHPARVREWITCQRP